LIFKRFSVDDGLSQNTIHSIIQDKKGFMWFGTQDGLNRFDGYEFRIFRNDPSDKNSLSNNYVWDVYCDSDGLIWAATFGGGLNSFDPVTEKFTNFTAIPGDENSLSTNRLFKITENPKGVIWIGSNDGLNRLDKSTGKITAFFMNSDRKDELTGNFIGSLANSQDGFLWFSEDSSLTRMSTSDLSFEHFRLSPYGSKINYTGAYNIYVFNDRLYFTCVSGLVSIDLKNRRDTLLIDPKGLNYYNTQLAVFTLLPDGMEDLWIGTNAGLMYADITGGKYRIYEHSTDDASSISYNNVHSLFRSDEGVLWIGTRNGLNAVYKTKPGFNSPAKNSDNSSLHATTSIIEDQNGIIWQGTPSGINLYDRTTGLTTELRLDESYVGETYVLSLKLLKDGSILAGARKKGMFKILPLTGKAPYRADVKKFNPGGIDINELSVHSITETKNGNIWIGTGGGGLIIYDPLTNKAKQYFSGDKNKVPSHPFIFSVIEDSFGNMWLGTASGGLNLFDPTKERFIYFQNDQNNSFSLSNNVILTLFDDNKGSLWIGTSAGLNKFLLPLKENMAGNYSFGSEEKPKQSLKIDSLFRKYGIKDGFPNEVIYGITQDSSGNLWISTNKGILKFDPGTGTVSKTYDISDGLLNNEFNQNAYFRSATGEMFFGGAGGMNYFYPAVITSNPVPPGVQLTGFRLYNEPLNFLKIEKYDFSIPASISYLEEIELKYFHKVLTFEFAALGFLNPEKNTYKYMLEGFDNDWVNAGNSRTATYTNLNAGEYNFRVIAANNDGKWNENGASIKLIVEPAPWFSWYAYTFYGILLVFAGYVFVRYRIKAATKELEVKARIEKAKSQERERFRKEAARDFHDESGSKLTKINLYAELAKMHAGKKESVDEYLQKIEKNSRELSSGMRDFIWAMDPEKDTLFDTINRLKDFGDDLFGPAGINFTVNYTKTDLIDTSLSMGTRRAISLIFKEAMNNCVKHSFAKNAGLIVSRKMSYFEISLKDDGKGFPESGNTDAGYGLKNMRSRADKCGAELLLNSSEEKGAHVTLRFNIQQMGN